MKATGEEVAKLRVQRKLSRTARGAITLTSAFGDSLVCVRHRVDPKARIRYVTVELLVQQTTIVSRQDVLVDLFIDGTEQDLQRMVRAAGGQWDSRARVWRISKRIAMALSLGERIILPT